MSLISIYTVMPPIETFGAIVAVLAFILAVVCFIGCEDMFGGNVIRNIIIGAVCVLVGSLILTFNTYHPNQMRYEYFITDMAQLEQLVDEGYVPINSDDNVYILRKGE